MDVDRRGEGADLVHADLRIVDEIRLVQHDHRRGAALPGDDQIALEPARIEVVIEAADEKYRVDIGRDDLFLGGIAGRAAREAAGPGENGLDAGVARLCRRLDRDPVADRGKIGAARGLVAQPSRHPGQPLVPPGEHTIDVRVLHGDPRRRQTLAPMRLEQLFEPSRPAKRLQIVGHSVDEAISCQRISRQKDLSES